MTEWMERSAQQWVAELPEILVPAFETGIPQWGNSLIFSTLYMNVYWYLPYDICMCIYNQFYHRLDSYWTSAHANDAQLISALIKYASPIYLI